MSQNRLLEISIVQILMSFIFLLLGLVEGLRVRCVLSSLLYMPCLVAVLVSTQYRCKHDLADYRKT